MNENNLFMDTKESYVYKWKFLLGFITFFIEKSELPQYMFNIFVICHIIII